MPRDDQSTASPPKGQRRAGRVGILLIAVAAAGVLFAVLAVRDDETVGASRTNTLDPTSRETTTSVDLQTEVVAQLRDILRRRQAAYRKRDPELLKEIYTVDCPCLESDSNAIRELIKEGYVWNGGETSIRVRRSERVSNRMWVVVATFSSEALRVETESGRLVRSEPQGSDLFQFVLAKPAGSDRWLLGRASSYDDG